MYNKQNKMKQSNNKACVVEEGVENLLYWKSVPIFIEVPFYIIPVSSSQIHL